MRPKLIRFSPFEINLEQRELRKSGIRIPLQHKPFRILEILLRQPGALVTRQELAKELWPGLHVDFEHSLNSAVNTLRQALGDSPRECRFIETRSGLGYRFNAPIEETASLNKNSVHHDYLRGRFFLNKMTSDGLQRAIGCFQSALDEEPAYALANAGLADCYCQLALSGSVRAADIRDTARAFATAAVTHQPALAEAHVSMGRVRMIFDWDLSGASEDWNSARTLNPPLAEVHRARALFFTACNRRAEALREIRCAQELDPLSLPIGFEHAWLLYVTGNFAEAVAQCWRVLTLEPAHAATQTILGLAYHPLGSLEEALTELENACVCSEREPAALASLGYVYGALGMTEKAHQLLVELAAHAKRRYVSSYWMAILYAGLGERELALEALRSAAAQREPQMLWANADPRLVSLGPYNTALG